MLRILIGIPLNLPTLNPEDVFEPCPALIYWGSRKGGISLTVSLVAVVLLLRRCRLLLFFVLWQGHFHISFPFLLQTLFPVSNPRRLQLWVDYFLRFDETAWSTQDPAIQDDEGDAEVRAHLGVGGGRLRSTCWASQREQASMELRIW